MNENYAFIQLSTLLDLLCLHTDVAGSALNVKQVFTKSH